MAAPYAVVARLSRGGMGVVDLGIDPVGDHVALKRIALYGSTGDISRARQRIRREAEVLRRLDHPGIVPLLDVIDDGDDMVLVFPYLPGGNLAERVTRHGERPPEEVALLADHLLGALAAAHRAGVVHRDVKPANVLFAEDGRPMLADFGVARGPDATPGLTASEMVVGTPGFMAPEQARGEPATAASDMFSLGATLAFAATGRGPFGDGDPRVLMHRAARGRVEPLPRSLPRGLRRRIGPMLDPRPERRPSAAAARGGPHGTWPHTTDARAGQAGRRVAFVAAATAVVALVAVIAWAGHPQSHAAATTRTTTPPATVACKPLAYQPCGQPAAPFTDGRGCIADHADYDGDTRNGCEAAPDTTDGTPLTKSVTANIVPATDVDEFPVAVSDNFQISCDGTLTLTLTAPAGMTLRLDVFDHGSRVGEAVSADGTPGVAKIREPNCGRDDSTTLAARVSPIGAERTAAAYTLTRSGSF